MSGTGGFKLEGFSHSAITGFDASSSRFRAVTQDVNGKLQLPSAGGPILGVLKDKGVLNDILPYQFAGIAQWECGGTVTLNDPVKTDALGRMVTASATDVANGLARGVAMFGGTVGQIGCALLFNNAQSGGGGFDDIVLGTTAPSALTETTFAQVTGTKTGVLPNGTYVGQRKRIVQSVAASTPVGTITGAFQQLSGTAAATLALGTAVASIADFIWNGTAWRLTSAIGGTGSSLA